MFAFALLSAALWDRTQNHRTMKAGKDLYDHQVHPPTHQCHVRYTIILWMEPSLEMLSPFRVVPTFLYPKFMLTYPDRRFWQLRPLSCVWTFPSYLLLCSSAMKHVETDTCDSLLALVLHLELHAGRNDPTVERRISLSQASTKAQLETCSHGFVTWPICSLSHSELQEKNIGRSELRICTPWWMCSYYQQCPHETSSL